MMATIWLCVPNKYNIWLVRGDVRGPRTGVWSLGASEGAICFVATALATNVLTRDSFIIKSIDDKNKYYLQLQL